MSDLERISWGPSGTFPSVLFANFIRAGSTTPGRAGMLSITGMSPFSVGPTGTVSGTMLQASASWSTGSLSFNADDPIAGVTVQNNGRALAIDWQSFLGGDDLFPQGRILGDVIDGGGGVNTVQYSDSASSSLHTIQKVGNVVLVSGNGKTDTLINIQQIRFSDRTIDVSTIAGTAISVLDTTTGQLVSASPQPYTGPVSGLQEQYINITSDSLNISTSTPNWFVHSGSGNDAIAVSSGTNVLDGGTGSNFLTGGSGTDTFFVDDRAALADIWSTVNRFHAGDAATIWGVTPQDFTLTWVDGQGVTGFTGLTLHATAAGKPTASLTLAGYTRADLNNGRLSVNFGTDLASGSAYMYVHGNS